MKYRIIHNPEYQVIPYQVQRWQDVPGGMSYWKMLKGFLTEAEARTFTDNLIANPNGAPRVIAEFDTEAA